MTLFIGLGLVCMRISISVYYQFLSLVAKFNFFYCFFYSFIIIYIFHPFYNSKIFCATFCFDSFFLYELSPRQTYVFPSFVIMPFMINGFFKFLNKTSYIGLEKLYSIPTYYFMSVNSYYIVME